MFPLSHTPLLPHPLLITLHIQKTQTFAKPVGFQGKFKPMRTDPILSARPLHAQVVVAVLLESFYAARQQFKEKEARASAAEARSDAAKNAVLARAAEEEARANAVPPASGDPHLADVNDSDAPEPSGVVVAADVAFKRAAAAKAAVAELQLDPLLEKLAAGFDTASSLARRIDMLFDRPAARPTAASSPTDK